MERPGAPAQSLCIARPTAAQSHLQAGEHIVASKASSAEAVDPNGILTHLITWSVAGVAAFFWFYLGPDDPIVAIVVGGWTLNLGLMVVPLALRLPPRWFRVPAGERALHRVLGVPVFGRLLDVSGWNRRVAVPSRNCPVNRANLPRLHLTMRAAAGAHAIAFVPHLGLAALALATGHPAGALWILLIGIPLHVYPVLLQRSMLLRLQPLLDAPAAAPAPPA